MTRSTRHENEGGFVKNIRGKIRECIIDMRETIDYQIGRGADMESLWTNGFWQMIPEELHQGIRRTVLAKVGGGVMDVSPYWCRYPRSVAGKYVVSEPVPVLGGVRMNGFTLIGQHP
jgi:hypothetical protein